MSKTKGNWTSNCTLTSLFPHSSFRFRVPRKAHQSHEPVSVPCRLHARSPQQPLGEGFEPPTTPTTELRHACLRAQRGELSSTSPLLRQWTKQEALVKIAPLKIKSQMQLRTLFYSHTDWSFIPWIWSENIWVENPFETTVLFCGLSVFFAHSRNNSSH